MIQRISLKLAALAVCALPAALPARLSPPAGTAVRLGIADLVERCDLCLEARITGARAVLEPGIRVDTEYTLSIERTFWGDPQASRTVRIPGGVLPDGSGMSIPGLPPLAIGEDAILFLSKADAVGMRMPIGLAQGRMTVATDLSGRKRIVRDQGGLAFAGSANGQDSSRVRGSDAAAVLEYASAVAEIEAAAAAKRARANTGDSKGAAGSVRGGK